MPPINKNPNKKQTGTVPKVTSSVSTTLASSVPPSSSSLLTTTSVSVASVNRQNDAGKISSASSSSHKNTEIVAPTRRDLNDLNDYLLSVAESSSTSSSLKQQNSVGGVINNSNLDTTCFDLDNLSFQENQRYCYPVRPIPRQHNKEITDHLHHQTTGTHRLISTAATAPSSSSISTTSGSNYHLTNNNSTSLNLNSAAAIGVVIPTTPNSTVVLEDNNYNNCNRSQQYQQHSLTNSNNQAFYLNGITTIGGSDSNSNQPNLNIVDIDLTWEQRLNFIQYFLSLTSKPNNKEKIQKTEKELSRRTNAKMVNERKENSDGVVNSTSLEDVVQSEASDTRAHSVTSIHTVSDPNTPSYEELQSKLEASNRNIQNIRDQQQHLLRLQEAAKQHLLEMENIRSQARSRPLTAPQNSDGVPEYESVNQVHDDMTNLVNRMKTLTTLIQGQHELSTLLGEDGPDVIAEQEALQRKLEELRVQKQDMKNLVSELQEISSAAERSAAANQQQQREDEARVVPVEYQRVVPIELIGSTKSQKSTQNGHYENHNGIHNGLASGSDTSDELNSENNIEEENPEMLAETTDLIRQKMADINAMKNQLKRLKDMMDTVKLIEEKTEGKSVKEIGRDSVSAESTPRESQQRKISNKSTDSVAATLPANSTDRDEVDRDHSHTLDEEEMSEKVRMLHEMTQDLREQARQMTSERERLKAIKEEIKRRREIAEKNSVRESSATRSIVNVNNTNLNNEAEKQILEAEYEAKKKEFEKLCQRLQDEDEVDERSDDVQEDEIEEEREIKEEPRQCNRDNWRRSEAASAPSVHGCKGQSDVPMTPLRGKDSADSGAVDVHGHPSIEAASFKSGSSRSYSVPPPMRSINNRDLPWRKNSQDNASSSQFNHFVPPPPPLPQQSGMALNWNPSAPYYYSTPYGQQYSPHLHSGGGDYCSHQCHSNVAAGTQQSVTGSVSADPVLIQQFIQTQQMLINSVSQCNQLLWHQQKEINNLNNAVLLLQERLLNSSDINLTRAESVPNPVLNTFCAPVPAPTSRAQSEQPQAYAQHPPMSPIRTHHAQNYNNIYHQQRRNIANVLQCSHNHCLGNSSANTSYNNFSSEQQGNFPSTATNLCSQIPPPQSSTQNFLNNDVLANSPVAANIHVPPPIFMHHHNNTITPNAGNGSNDGQGIQHHHPNNSNLLNSQQNCLNSPNQTSVPGGTNNINSVPNTSSNAAAAAAALNNQVPPGNRANNYWDNFRR